MQVEIEDCDREKTAFLADKRIMQFKSMPQGFRNCPSIFQIEMMLILEGLLETACLVYIDDILVYGSNKEEHDKNLQKVMNRLEEYGLPLRHKKCRFGLKEVEFLGYKMGDGVIKPLLKRCQGIRDYQTPRNKKELQRFLGHSNYDRCFIPQLADSLSPMYRLLNKDAKFKWNEEEEKIFQQIKKKWCENLELQIPSLDEDFESETGAFDLGLGAVLKQKDGAIAYASRSLNKTERNYSITEKEMLAAIWAMKKFRYLLEGRKFTLTTDHKPLKEINRKVEF